MRSSRHRRRRIPPAQIVGEIDAFLSRHLHEAIHIADLCELTGVSERSVRNACHAVCGMSPTRYFMHRRMEAVHHALEIAEPARGTVTRLATDYGFFELGRFAATYAAMFGERPSETLRDSAHHSAL